MVLKRGGLPLPVSELGRRAGVSKGLIYAYFPTQFDLFNAMLLAEIATLERSGLAAAVEQWDFTEAVIASACLYFDHVAEHGPLMHVILRDSYMAGHVSREVRAFRDRLFGKLARSGRRHLGLKAKETIAAANLVLTIPEEAGRLAFGREMTRARARELCSDLVTSALKAIAPAA